MNLSGSRTVVTGGTGFLGRHVVQELRAVGAHVTGLGSRDYDLRQRHEIDQLLEKEQPNAVVHLAAVVGGIGANAAQPGKFFYENALMGIELIEACRLARIDKVLIAGTVCAYPKYTDVPFREEDLWGGYPEETNAPYGLAKKMLLVQAQAYRAQYGMNAIYVLPTNLYGPYDNFDLETCHVIPAMIRRFIEARDHGDPSVILWGDGTPTREFLYVEDAARAFALALEGYNGADPVNLGSGNETSMRELAEVIRQAVNYTGEIKWDTSKPNGQPRRRLDTSKAAAFGFRSSIDFDEGIRRTVKWYESEALSANPATV